LFIDDQEKNCKSAELLEIKSIQFFTTEKLKFELKKLKISL